jgi:TATA-box binding protein (TBP) (component of TFIID and TFIIIB)
MENNCDIKPISTLLRVSTHTATCNLNSEINLKLISKYLKISKQITYIEYGDDVPKGVNVKQISQKAKDKKKVFYNQITFIVQPEHNRTNNVKLFNNGAISMTGLKKLEDGEKSVNIILDSIKNIKGCIYTPINKDDLMIKYSLESEDKIPPLECHVCHQKSSYHNMSTMKCNHYICNLCSKSNVKLDKCPSCNTSLEEHAIVNKEQCKITNYKIVLINSDFYAGFEIKRDILHEYLIDKYQIFSSYEPCIYPGVNSKFYWNKKYMDKPHKGKCYCTKLCNGKGDGDGNGNCKKITISTFQSGSVIITGARSMEQINDAYNFINRVFEENYQNLKKVNAPFLEQSENNKSNNNNKKKVIKLKRTNIHNLPPDNILQKYLEMNKSIS